MTPAVSTSAFGPLRAFGNAPEHAPFRAGRGYRVTGSAHVLRAGSPPNRFRQDQFGPPPLLRCAGHPASSAESHRCVQRPTTATAVPRAVWWGAVWSEVKEEGRIDLSRSERMLNRPGGHERNTAPRRTALSQIEPYCLQTSAKGRERSFVSGRSFYALRVARSAVGPLT